MDAVHVEMDSNSINSGYINDPPPQTEEQPVDGQMNVGRNLLEELKAERNALDPSFLHCARLLDKEISLSSSVDSNVKHTEKIYVPIAEQRKYNLVGRLLGPKGSTLKRIQNDTQTKMSILGRSSMKDRQKEEELRNSTDANYQHLKDDLHVLIEANPPFSSQKLAAGIADVRKMLIPPQPGQPDFSTKFDHPQLLPHPGQHMMRGPPLMSHGPGGGRMRGGGGFGGRGKPGGRGGQRGGPRGGGGRGRGRGGGMNNGPRPDNGRFGGPIGREQPSMDTWRDNAISKDYNHGSTGDYGGRGLNDSYPSSEPYYSNFSDQGVSDLGYGGANARASDWKSPRPSARRDNRHHPYGGGGGMGGGTEGFYYDCHYCEILKWTDSKTLTLSHKH